MAKVLVSEKYLHDIANAIRVKLDSQSTYTPSQMALAIADITGAISGTITPSTDTDKVLVTDSNLTAIANAIRAKLDVATTYTPAQMADAILSIQAAGPTIVTWASGSDADVAAMIDAAQAGTIDLQQDGGWAVGDVRTITIGAFTDGTNVSHAQQSIDIVITSFDEYMSCGNVMQFDFKDQLSNGSAMNSEETNEGGYGATVMKTETLPALVNALPEWLKSRLIEFSVLTSAGKGSSTIVTVTGNKLALRSGAEVSGTNNYSFDGEGTRLSYYTDSSNRIKKRGHNGLVNVWYTRSPYKNSDAFFCSINTSGAIRQGNSTAAYGIAPFGCL